MKVLGRMRSILSLDSRVAVAPLDIITLKQSFGCGAETLSRF